ncbi:hypothetical protein LE181_30645, partial [Streptomyces sp. SCA3-4]|nr:hypothetical protein [Streptomyces sichuanensis]
MSGAMVTFAQAQERAERWVNGEVPAYLQREVCVREFGLGFVCWAEDREDGPAGDGARLRMVIARDSGETTLWPGLPVGEVIRRYEEEYGTVDEPAPSTPPTPPRRVDLEATSFLLSPPQWLQDAADAIGIPDRRSGSPDTDAGSPAGAAGAGALTGAADAGASASGPASGGASAPAPDVAPASDVASAPAGPGAPAQGAAPASGAAPDVAPAPASASGPGVAPGAGAASASAPASPPDLGAQAPAVPGARDAADVPGTSADVQDAVPDAPWADVDVTARPSSQNTDAGGSSSGSLSSEAWASADVAKDDDDRSVGLPATVLAPALSGTDLDDTPPPGVRPEAKTELMPQGSALPRTTIAPALDVPGSPPEGGRYARTQLVSQLDEASLGAGMPGGPAAPAAPGRPGTPPPGAPAFPGPAH